MNKLDIFIFIAYGLIIIVLGLWVSRNKGKGEKNSTDYFLAGKSLPWWLVGTSIIAANISAEQFIGMSGSGFAIGIGIATYEWLAALILILVAKYFLPVFIRSGIFTMPQFLAMRYDNRIKSILAVFWLVLFIFVNLTSILYLGALSLQTIFGLKLVWGVWGLAIFTLVYTTGGGLKSIASTDIIQVVFLVAGGLLTTILALNAVSDDGGAWAGFTEMLREYPEKFHMILQKDDPNYIYLPGIRAVFGGIWIAGIYYFGANQYIIQKALGSKNLREAQRGMVFAGYLKLLLPILVVIPGIAAFSLAADIAKPDQAWPWLLNQFVPPGIRGLVFAALIAAIVSSLSAIINSTATIFTIDIYKAYLHPSASEGRLVTTGRISGIAAILIASAVAPYLGNIEQAFQFIQEYTGMISPGITAIFLFGLFWKKTSSRAALWSIPVSIAASVVFKFGFSGMPFLDQMSISFLVVAVFIAVFSWIENGGSSDKGALLIPKGTFRTGKVFNATSIGIITVLIILYIYFW